MARASSVIKIPKPPRSAFNKNRPVSELLWAHVEHLAAAVKRDIDDERRAVRTEGDASAFIQKYTAMLHPARVLLVPQRTDGAAKKRKRSSPSSKTNR